MDLTAIIISAVALSLSIFTFYWTSIREVKRFYLVRVDRMGSMIPEFALVNGGSKDILITTIQCGFESKDRKSCSYPAQRLDIAESESLLLPSEKAFHCKVDFLVSFTSSFALEGEKDTSAMPPIYQREMRVNVAWVEQSGTTHKASAIISKYGFSEDGHIRFHTPMVSKHDLYKKS